MQLRIRPGQEVFILREDHPEQDSVLVKYNKETYELEFEKVL